jgi:hypothetical protein
MIPQIKAKFRKRNGVPYTVERLTGAQYRCRLCNTVFFDKKKLENHLKLEIRSGVKKKVNTKCPKIDDTINTIVFYAEDILNAFKAVNVKQFKSGDIYDGMLRRKKGR